MMKFEVVVKKSGINVRHTCETWKTTFMIKECYFKI